MKPLAATVMSLFLLASASGLSYSLVYPGFGVEALRRTPPQDRVAMGAYTAFPVSAVLKTTSPDRSVDVPKHLPSKTVPSSGVRIAVFNVGCSSRGVDTIAFSLAGTNRRLGARWKARRNCCRMC